MRDRLRALADGRGHHGEPEPTRPRAGLTSLDLLAAGFGDPRGDGSMVDGSHVEGRSSGLDDDGSAEGDTPRPVVLARTSLRPVVVAVLATALSAWAVVHVVAGGAPASVELVAGSPIPSVAGVLVPGTEPGAASSPGAAPSVSASSAAVVVVQVIGQVRRPGLVRLGPGARVADALAAAGGLVRGGGSGGLNLARPVVDGEQIVVSPRTAPAPTAGVTGTAGASADAVVVDLNLATAGDLDSLPGVGPVMAGRILEWRTAHGRFASVDQLREISGIGARTFARLKPHVRI